MSENKAIKEWHRLELSSKYMLFEEEHSTELKEVEFTVTLLISEIERLEAENTRLREAVRIAIQFLNRIDNSSSKYASVMLTLDTALERK